MKKKTLITALQYLIFLALGIVLIVHMFNGMSAADKADMLNSIRQTKLWFLVPVFICGFLSHWFRAIRWKLLLRPLHITPTTFNTTLSVLIGYVVNLLVPRMGEVAKCTVLAKYENVPADKMIGTIVAERTFDVFTLAVVTLLAFLTQADIIGNYAADLMGKMAAKQTLLYIALAGLVIFVAVLVLIYRKYSDSKIGKFIKGLADGVKAIWVMKTRWQFLGLTVLIWGMYWFQLQLTFWAMPATMQLGGLTALVLLVFGSVGMIATPGGIGAYPLLLAQILLFYGVKQADGNAFGWVSWTLQTAMVIAFGIISLILLPLYNTKKHNAQATVDTE